MKSRCIIPVEIVRVVNKEETQGHTTSRNK